MNSILDQKISIRVRSIEGADTSLNISLTETVQQLKDMLFQVLILN